MPKTPTKTPTKPKPTPAPDQLPVAAAPVVKESFTTQTTAAAATAAPDRVQPTAAPVRKATEFQELACDLFSSFLFEGAAADLAPMVVRTLAMIQWNKSHPTWPRDREKRLDEAGQWSDRVTSDWYAKLLRGIPEKAETPPTPKPRTATEQIRNLYREELREKFEEFMSDASPEEIIFLNETLRGREGNVHYANGDRVEAVEIANAFESTLTNRIGTQYLRVPEDAVEAIEQLLNVKAEAA